MGESTSRMRSLKNGGEREVLKLVGGGGLNLKIEIAFKAVANFFLLRIEIRDDWICFAFSKIREGALPFHAFHFAKKDDFHLNLLDCGFQLLSIFHF